MSNQYELVIKFDEGGGTEQTKQDKARQNAIKSLNAIKNVVSTQVIKPFISSVENIYLNNLQTNTGSTQLVERQRFVFNAVRQGISIYQSAMGGVAFANAIGISGFAGGVIGVGLFALNSMLNIVQNANDIRNQTKIEDFNIQYQQTRMGTAYNKSRMGV